MSAEFVISGKNEKALFTLKLYRGEGMALLAMNWKDGRPPVDFVGFAIEYREPGGTRFFSLKNRLSFANADGTVAAQGQSTRVSPIQKFRWVHFPRHADLPGEFSYRVTPVFMDALGELSYGDFQEADVELRRETYPGLLNVAFTRGFVSSQAFVDRYGASSVPKLIPSVAKTGLGFVPTYPEAAEALQWMGFEARSEVLALLDHAITDPTAQVRVVAYDLNVPEIVTRLEQLGPRLRVIVDDSDDHGAADSAETAAAERLRKSAGKENVKRQHLGSLQHNKTIVVDGASVQAVVCGSTNFSWRGFFVQSNNAVVIHGERPVKAFTTAFESYWSCENDVDVFGKAASAKLVTLGLDGVNVRLGFSPYATKNSQLQKVAGDIAKTKSSLFYSLAFLYQTKGPIRDAIEGITANRELFVYGISDNDVEGLDVQPPDGNPAPVSPAALTGNVPEPFRSEPAGGGGIRMHHKFVVIDFDKPTARVYLGSYNFSDPADRSNGENLLLIRDRRVATSYMVEAVRIFDHYEFRLLEQAPPAKKSKKKPKAKTAKKKPKPLALARPPREKGQQPWWEEDYSNPRKARDRELFA